MSEDKHPPGPSDPPGRAAGQSGPEAALDSAHPAHRDPATARGRRRAGTHRKVATEPAAETTARFRDVFASGEFRALFAASTLSWIGDFLAKAAVTALVYRQTGSAAISAAGFAISFAPWVLGGPVLAALAERYPFRPFMIVCDLSRAALVAVVAIPGMPVPAMLALLFVTSLLNPPFEAARSALIPRVLDGDRYVLGTVAQNATNQGAQLAGYLIGAAVAAYHPHVALFADAGTFAVSAVLVGLFVGSHRPGLEKAQRTHLLRETAEGFHVVFGTDVLRAIAVLIFSLMLYTTLPEGLAAAWAGSLTKNLGGRGLDQAMIMIGYPAGYILGGLIIGRLVSPRGRRRLIRPLAVIVPLMMVPAVFGPPASVVALMAFGTGFAVAGLFPSANGLFVRALPDAFRARAFGVMQSGVQVLQGVSIFACGALADHYALPKVVGLWSLVGVLVMLVAGAGWPSHNRFEAAFRAADAANSVDPGSGAGQDRPRSGAVRAAESV